MDSIICHIQIGDRAHCGVLILKMKIRIVFSQRTTMFKISILDEFPRMIIRASIYFFIFSTVSSCTILEGNSSSHIELKRSWELVQFFDESGSNVHLNEDEPLTLRFLNESEVGGDADCNLFGGEYKAKVNGEMNIKNLYSTEIACEEPTLGYTYLEVLSSVQDFKKEDGRLILSYDKKGKLIFLERLE